MQWRIWSLASGGGGGKGSQRVGSRGKAPVGVPGCESSWTLKALSVYEIENQASIRLKMKK